jgi:hypothetical protein
VSDRRRSAFAIAAVAAVVAAVVAGMSVLGSPSSQRSRRLDQRRLDDLRAAAGSIDLYWTRNGQLPGSLDELPGELLPQGLPRDPETAQPYEYSVAGENRYRLCATFTRASSTDEAHQPRGDFWWHAAGRHCFDLEAKRVER